MKTAKLITVALCAVAMIGNMVWAKQLGQSVAIRISMAVGLLVILCCLFGIAVV